MAASIFDERAGLPHVLIVDDEPSQARIIAAQLTQQNYHATPVFSADEALEIMEREIVDLVITDLRMPKIDGLGLLQRLREEHSGVPVIMLTAHGSIETAVEAIRLGAVDYLQKPTERLELLQRVELALSANDTTTRDVEPMLDMESRVDQVAAQDLNVLILGETGTGKTRLARYIHDHSPRRDQTFVEFDCSTLTGSLADSELFGHVRGAFTGATTNRLGAARLADKGTLFLDEIGELTPELQVKLLTLIEARRVRPVGADNPVNVDVRIITATKQDLRTNLKSGGFRDDLFFRIAGVEFNLRPLRDRPGVIAKLATEFVTRHANNIDRQVELAPEALRLLEAHDWSGNIRELQNVICKLVLLSTTSIITEQNVRDLAPEVVKSSLDNSAACDSDADNGNLDLRERVRQLEASLIRRALLLAGGNRKRAAQLLGISRRTLYNKMHDLGMDPKDL